ncbi:chemotaxis protein CheA [Aromatoleum toluclasticum]|uniref:chemotaxis protein CheA n=1 Tax=Aromatoleum toluclasticum TaxID=92003 RepID=UPI00037076D5|nr:chemotaxis protein CheA [Aromatoleum toluclasticum]
MSTIDLTQFNAVFFAESAEGLCVMEDALLHIEQGSREPERLNEIFRAVHSIKGTAGSLGFDAVAGFAHEVETLLDEVRRGRHEPDAEMIDAVLASVDCLRALLRAAENGTAPDAARADALRERLLGWLREAPPAPAVVMTSAPVQAGDKCFRIAFRPHRDFFHSGNDPLRLVRALAALGAVEVQVDAAAVPEFAAFDPEQCYLAWELALSTDAARAEIEDILDWVSTCCEVCIDELAPMGCDAGAPAPPSASAPQAGDEPEPVTAVRTGSLHVSAEKADELVDLVGELVITQTMLKQLTAGFDMGRLARLKAAVSQLERNTRELQRGVMGIRMLPVSFAFGRFARLVRDVSQQLGKQVRLQISGEQSELDKTVIERLIDPLTHLVRNALDHGIEPPAERTRAGKPATAVLTLHAEHVSGNIEIEVRDDGRGIDRDKVRANAIDHGLIGADEEFDGERATQFIFLPGFSTADAVSDLSGRGVGLDVVRRNIDELGGSLRVESTPGAGTAFIIRLPLTLAIVDGMSVAVGHETYIVPMRFIVECLTPREGEVRTIAGHGRVVDVRGDYVPVAGADPIRGRPCTDAAGPALLLLLEADGRRVALPVDGLLGQNQVVIKSLETHYRKFEYFAGATILGDGRVALILDVNALVRSAMR